MNIRLRARSCSSIELLTTATIEATFFGLLLKVNEGYIDGHI
jgi:hypothetical protein